MLESRKSLSGRRDAHPSRPSLPGRAAEEEMWHEHGVEHRRWQQEIQRGLQENSRAKHLQATLLDAWVVHCQPGTEMR
jgi:hypothetical protein